MYDNAIRIGVSRQLALRRELDIIANNVANLNTKGFKADALTFKETLQPYATTTNFKNAQDARPSYVLDPIAVTNQQQGSLIQTDRSLDVALADSDTFFVIEKANGDKYYTRNGEFHINADGDLVNNSGDLVSNQGGGPITFAPAETNIVFANDGSISTDQGAKGGLEIVRFDNINALKKVGDVLFEAPEGVEAEVVENPQLRQGYIENANVQPIKEIARMIEVTNAYKQLSEAMKSLNELKKNGIQRLGSLPS